jgi:hypothetical protein
VISKKHSKHPRRRFSFLPENSATYQTKKL